MKPYKVKNGCWIWQGLKNNGYGLVYVSPNMLFAHKYVYENERGKLPKRTNLLHMCKNKACVNPEHMKPRKRKAIQLYGAVR